ncbi:MAG: glycoside hydrolase family 3 C-terminal domain-containing protein [Chloroflexota bacterium]|nr:glycoside hydrolase family 3 C-terminal domain-containing protein [Chloroflexota bacterium]
MENSQTLISKMTLEEKASLCSGLGFWHTKGIERLGIPSIMLTDGPHGLRKQIGDSDLVELEDSVPATCFPTASTQAATWNRELIFMVGKALGEECRQEKVGVILGPGANIKRTPLCGRNFEYFSEDPFLSGEMAKSHIQGVQSQEVGTSLKHYAVNNQEYRRMTIDVIVDQRALHEIYLAGFEIAVKGAQPWTVMCAYNKVNGTYCCEHPYLLEETLKEEWGYEGLVVTDWGAMNERIDALKVGLELEMPGVDNGNTEKLIAAVQSGDLEEALLDKAVERILDMIFKAHKTLEEDYIYDAEAHHALARDVAAEGAVLLKNDANALPIKKNTRIALLGAFAKAPRYQGAGSSTMNPPRLDNLYDEMVHIAGQENITYAPGYSPKGTTHDKSLIDKAVEISKQADIVVINVGLPDIFEVEGLDRTHLQLPESLNKLIAAVAAVHSKVVVVLSNGSPVEMPWVDNVQAILEGYLGGQAGAGGVADIIFGITNPSGKLAETFPIKLEDTPSYHHYPGGPKTVEYRESLYVGYRFYDKVEKEVLFPFGHGLSYTNFEYGDLHLSQEKMTGQESLTVTFTVKNTGNNTGKEVVQLYVSPQAPTVFRPTKELKGFEKLDLQPGDEKTISMTLSPRAFAFYNTGIHDWQVESGSYRILVGASSRDIRLEAEVTIASTQDGVSIPDRDRHPVYINFPSNGRVSQEDFQAIIGHKLPSNELIEGETCTLNTPIADMQHSLIGRMLRKQINKQIQTIVKTDPDSPNALMMKSMINEMPLRTLLMFGSELNRGMLEGLLMMINGKFFKGLSLLLKSRNK